MPRFFGLLLAIFALASCTSTKEQEDRFLAEVSQMRKEEILARGDALAAKKRFAEARKYYSFLADTFPNDPQGRLAALRIADTFFSSKDPEAQAEAQVRYKDFATRFPNDPHRVYALLMLGRTYYQQARGPQRDLTPIKEAAEAFEQAVSLNPESPEAQEARGLLVRCREYLAQHELQVAKYYLTVGAEEGAKNRLKFLLARYPETEAAKQAQELLRGVEASDKAQVRQNTGNS
ncbi:MAG: outer membrane protein assembly factor BamD [Thermoanaerobaculaceae bacterium]